ncbi:MAG TPA: APC family permease [Pseudonocardiaceae bacterium]|nr:APC family permease [Pseudonocardiaceae bacterium]
MSTTAQRGSSDVLRSERVAGGMLPRVLGIWDMVAIFVAIVLLVTGSATIQAAGPAAFGWWVLGVVAFLIPGAVVTGQLGVMFPGEGSIYLWTHKAFGDFWGFFAGFCAWWPGVLAMLSFADNAVAYLGYAFPGSVGHWSVPLQGLVIVGALVGSALVAQLRLRIVQNAVNAVCLLYGMVILLVVVAGVVYLVTGHAAATNPAALSTWSPSHQHGINFANWAFFGVVVLALLGVEVPLNMGVEIRDRKAITRYLLWGSAVVVIAYLATTWAVMVTVPAAGNQSVQITAVADVVGRALGPAWGQLAAAVLAGVTAFALVVYNYSFARLVFVSGLDCRLPSLLTRLNTHRVPYAALWAQTVVAAVVTVVTFIALPALSSGTALDTQTRVYTVLSAATTVIWCFSMIVLFIDVLVILRRYRPQFAARPLARPAVFWACAALGAVSSLVAIVATLSGSQTPLISNNAGSITVLGATISYGLWFYLVAGITAVSLTVGVVLYLIGRRTEARTVELDHGRAAVPRS